jgi:hypothetical protein
MKRTTVIIAIFALLTLIYVCLPKATTAQDKTDTFRDMLISIQEETPNKQVTLDFISKSYSPSGTISHVGDDYVCIDEYPQVQACVQFDKIQGIELHPNG